jgi:hypothetical protein
MVFAGILFAFTRNFYLLLFAATIGVISPSGNEVGPFLAIEQSALAQTLSAEKTHPGLRVVSTSRIARHSFRQSGWRRIGGDPAKWRRGSTIQLPGHHPDLCRVGLALGVLFNFVSPQVEVL